MHTRYFVQYKSYVAPPIDGYSQPISHRDLGQFSELKHDGQHVKTLRLPFYSYRPGEIEQSLPFFFITAHWIGHKHQGFNTQAKNGNGKRGTSNLARGAREYSPQILEELKKLA